MLAKTCSQIGADTGLVRPAGSGGTSTTGNGRKSNESSSSSAAIHNGVRKSKNEDGIEDLSGSRSRSSSAEIRVTVDAGDRDPKKRSPPPRLPSTSGSSSLSPASNLTSGSPLANAASPPGPTATRDAKATSPSSTAAPSTSGSSPIIRSGLEVLAGYPGDVPLGMPRRPGDGAGLPPPLSALGDMKSLMAAGAFPRPPLFLGAAATSSLNSNPFLQAAGLLPPASPSMSPSPPSSACRDPLCRDPTCPTSIWNHHRLASSSAAAAAAAACRSFSLGISSYSPALMVQQQQQQQHREAMMMAAAIAKAASSQSTSSSTGPAGGPLPHVCNWVLGTESWSDDGLNSRNLSARVFLGAEYCGRRFATSEDLLIHLKTHTNLSTSDPMALTATAAAAAAAVTPTASSSSTASRFHPYARPSSGPPPSPSAAAAGLSSLCLPPTAGYLNHYATTAAAAAAAAASLYPSLLMRPPLM